MSFIKNFDEKSLVEKRLASFKKNSKEKTEEEDRRKNPIDLESIQIGLASPETIRQWAQKILPNGKIVGKVTNSQTVNYKTLKPVKDGLFCEKIFGPVENFVCSCGKKPEENQRYCNECDVEYTLSRVRRSQLGFIQLICSVAHVWYVKGRVNYISIVLGIRRRKTEGFFYGTRVTHHAEIEKKLTRDTELLKFAQATPFTITLPTKAKKKVLVLKIEDTLKKKRTSSHWFCSYKRSLVLPAPITFAWHHEKDRQNFLDFFHILPNPLDYRLPEYFPKDETILSKKKSKVIAPIDSHKKLDISAFFRIKSEPILDQLSRIGAQPLQKILTRLNFPLLQIIQKQRLRFLDEEIEYWESFGFLLPAEKRIYRKLQHKRLVLVRRLKLAQAFRRTQQRPEWMLLSVIPVIPPDLRPILQLDGDQVAISDLNILYQKILFRNKRLKRKSLSLTSTLFSLRLLQESVDALLDNGKGGSTPLCASNGRPLKSLSDLLKGKQGRFRQNLLGKRVDYSGRSVIVVGPKLQIHECGLPKEMALELFQPFLIQDLLLHKIANTILEAKKLIAQQNFIIWEVLEQLLQDHLVLLNRAPTLHRLGVQAFQPKLVNGRAILLHPLVCTAFNADFDGDQMAVHIPLSYQARSEAWQLMWSRNNILSPATGQPILAPSQDMVLGCYYLTTENPRNQKGQGFLFSSVKEALVAYVKNEIEIHAFIWIRYTGNLETENYAHFPIELRIDSYGNRVEIYENDQHFFDFQNYKISQQLRTSLGRALFNEILQDCLKPF